MATQFEIFRKLYEPLLYHGPGSEASTLRALAAARNLPPCPDILDIGCGPGRQTLELARGSEGRLTAIDTFQSSLTRLKALRDQSDLQERIGLTRGSMTKLPPEDWWDYFYRDLSAQIEAFADGFSGADRAIAQAVVEQTELETEILREGEGAYSYVFYIMRKPL